MSGIMEDVEWLESGKEGEYMNMSWLNVEDLLVEKVVELWVLLHQVVAGMVVEVSWQAMTKCPSPFLVVEQAVTLSRGREVG